ncbi:1,4-dihydroxy-2-naphthoate polyprenyltransferase [Solicola gregarius]|uniref:1,4-dihydroxy-2-naphthoate octaprenyltransferase n=1 Tax=Solicola gregarius TaxID=2908642 RepID=A0AA46YJJ7_9ACTN|nr:1,4-dihydroxy-2-naphthoate polyprenyltransferase [Solicola gregarius]UYM03659.1 1,4-dihydroxy-2-naphthoate polyprenyltransferase [Solicola gregarius]
MATASQWIEGARPRTLPAAISPVVAGTGAAAFADSVVWWRAVLCLVLALLLQIGVNFANDYSDGIRGTDDERVGPLRLVGSRVATAGSVKAAAFGCFAVGAAAGLVLAAATGWWLLLIGAAAIAAAWFYTGGSTPYGYRALGEVSVFVFFGLVAVIGTTYVQVEEVTWPSVAAAVGLGALICAILVANNLRDIPTDRESDKRTLAVVMGDRGTRMLFVALQVVALAVIGWLVAATPWTLLALVALAPGVRASLPVVRGATGMALIPTLRDTGLTALAYGIGLGIGLALG